MGQPTSVLPAGKHEDHRRGKRLEWTTIGIMVPVIMLVYFALGSSQAMKTAWVEDILSLVPPVAFLVAARYHTRPPNKDFPYGFHRAIGIAFLCAAVALCTMGAYLLYESAIKLVNMEHPTIGSFNIFGRHLWHGWVMIAVLALSAIPAIILGRMKLSLARKLHDKALYADADMNKADWMTAGAAILGIVGVGVGLWWADAVAAVLISFSILRDGWKHLGQVVYDLMDMVPTKVGESEADPLPDLIQATLEDMDWVEKAQVRLREAGHVFIGEAYVLTRGETNLLSRSEQATAQLKAMHPRLHDFVVIPATTLQRQGADVGEG